MTRSAPAPKKTETDPHKLDVSSLAKGALVYALRRGRRLAWTTGNARIGTKAVCEDAAQEAVASLFGAARGSRKWNPETSPDPHQYLRSTVNSLLSNQLVSAEEKAKPLDESAWLVADLDDPETRAIASQEKRWQERFEDEFIAGVLADPDLLALYTAMEKLETDKPAQLAEQLGLPVREIDSRKRKLRHLGSKIWAAMDQEVDGEEHR